MSDTKYTEKEIEWALSKLREKDSNRATRENAIKLLDKFKEFGDIVVDKIEEDKNSGILKPSKNKIN